MFPSVSPYMSEDDLVNHLKSHLQLIAKQRGLSCFVQSRDLFSLCSDVNCSSSRLHKLFLV